MMVPSFRPAVQQSGTGGTFNLPSTANMTVEGEFGTVPVGAPVFGHDTGENGDHIWYFDGTPAATVRIFDTSPPQSLFVCIVASVLRVQTRRAYQIISESTPRLGRSSDVTLLIFNVCLSI